jgi:hypothetical protein
VLGTCLQAFRVNQGEKCNELMQIRQKSLPISIFRGECDRKDAVQNATDLQYESASFCQIGILIAFYAYYNFKMCHGAYRIFEERVFVGTKPSSHIALSWTTLEAL